MGIFFESKEEYAAKIAKFKMNLKKYASDGIFSEEEDQLLRKEAVKLKISSAEYEVMKNETLRQRVVEMIDTVIEAYGDSIPDIQLNMLHNAAQKIGMSELEFHEIILRRISKYKKDQIDAAREERKEQQRKANSGLIGKAFNLLFGEYLDSTMLWRMPKSHK